MNNRDKGKKQRKRVTEREREREREELTSPGGRITKREREGNKEKGRSHYHELKNTVEIGEGSVKIFLARMTHFTYYVSHTYFYH